MRRFTEMPLSVNPTKNDHYLLVYKEDWAIKYGNHYSYEYTTTGGWNSFVDHNGETYAESAISSEHLAEKFRCWLRPASVGSERWADTLAIILDEVSAEKNATEPTEGEEIGRYEILDELEGYLIKALQFAEEVE